VKGNFHAPFWTGGGEGDLLADHTEINSLKKSVHKSKINMLSLVFILK
jgi:hypothetical protein